MARKAVSRSASKDAAKPASGLVKSASIAADSGEVNLNVLNYQSYRIVNQGFPVSFSQDVQAKFISDKVIVDANYEFGSLLKVTIHTEFQPNDGDNLTAKEIQEAPIRLAIEYLQKLLDERKAA